MALEGQAATSPFGLVAGKPGFGTDPAPRLLLGDRSEMKFGWRLWDSGTASRIQERR